MPLPTFTPSVAPSPGATRKPELNLITPEFGDGYTLALPNGLNHIRDVVSLNWDVITLTQLQELEGFFRERGGYKPFWFQPYGFAAPVKWTCQEWTSTTQAPHTFSATLRQSFTLVT